jgi:WD40 repeat protein
MNNNLLFIVRRIIADNGEGILGDPARLKALFSDLAKDEPKPLRIACGRGLEAGAYMALTTAPDAAERISRKAAIAQRVRDDQGLDMSLCAEALDILESAIFGTVSSAGQGRSAQQTPPIRPQPRHQQPQSYHRQMSSPPEAPVRTAPTPVFDMPVTPPLAKKHTLRNDVQIAVGILTALIVGVVVVVYQWHQQSLAAEAEKQLWQVLTISGGNAYSAVYSPDGRRIVSAGDDTVSIWDAENGALNLTLRGHSGSVQSAAYSPDGRRIVSASNDNTVKIWDAENGVLIRTLMGHTFWVYAAAYSPDGRRIVSASWDKTVKIWDAESGALIRTLSGYPNSVDSAAYSPDGRRIVSVVVGNPVQIIDAESGALIHTLMGHSDFVQSAVYSPDGRRIASASWDNTVKIWDAESGALIRTLTGHSYGAQSAAYSPDGRRIVSSSHNAIKIWDAESGALIRTLKGHNYGADSAAYSPDGRRIVSSSIIEIKIWNAGE